jgi:hypothetical protein
MNLYKRKQKQNPSNGYEIIEKSGIPDSLLSLGFKQLQHPCKNKRQKAVEKGVGIKT